MPDANDMDLVREYATRNSEPAFETLVRRHVSLVYSVALRQVGNPGQAEEITQAVFLILARKAARLRPDTILPGWLHETARFASASFLRGELRRQRREQEAYVQSKLQESTTDPAWEQLAPLLDEAIGQLGKSDRNAVVLRFFQNKSAREIAAALNVHESAAQKRLNRAVEKLRAWFLKRGVAVSAKGTAISSSTLTLIKGALKIMALTKAKSAVVIGAVVLLTGGITTLVVDKVVYKNSWADNPKYWETDSRVLGKVPAGVFIFRPTRFTNGGGGVWAGDRMVAKNYSVGDLVDNTYGFSQVRTVFPPDMPREHFDVMSTMTGGSTTLVKNKLQKRFRLTAHPETRDTDVQLLKVQNPNPPGLKPHVGNDRNSSSMGGKGIIKIQNQQLSRFVGGTIESRAGVPVLDETGLTGHYDLQLQWQRGPGESDKDAFVRAVREQLGLELVPATRPIEMLVVEKAK
jgi:uncharacterized protein (TIGR03435 family)